MANTKYVSLSVGIAQFDLTVQRLWIHLQRGGRLRNSVAVAAAVALAAGVRARAPQHELDVLALLRLLARQLARVDAVLHQVGAQDLVVQTHAQAERHVDQLEQQERDNRRPRDDSDARERLHPEQVEPSTLQ